MKLEDGILSEGIGREYQGHFLDLTLVSNRGLFVLMLHFKRHLDILRGEEKGGLLVLLQAVLLSEFCKLLQSLSFLIPSLKVL